MLISDIRREAENLVFSMAQRYTLGMMKKILFLEGPVQTGKSTLIRTLLGDHLSGCGGFSSQRLIDAGGSTRGFRLGPAAVTPPAAPAEDYIAAPGSPLPFAADCGIFKWFCEDGRVITDQSVFDTVGVSLLSSSLDSPLILLDEIGGSELLCGPFCQALDEVLSSGLPCLGVMKLADGARRLERQYPSDKGWTLLEKNKEIRRRVLSLGGRILYYERGSESGSDIKPDLSAFIQSVFI